MLLRALLHGTIIFLVVHLLSDTIMAFSFLILKFKIKINLGETPNEVIDLSTSFS